MIGVMLAAAAGPGTLALVAVALLLGICGLKALSAWPARRAEIRHERALEAVAVSLLKSRKISSASVSAGVEDLRASRRHSAAPLVQGGRSKSMPTSRQT